MNITLKNFFERCIYITMCLFLFVLVLNFVFALGIFSIGDITTTGGIQQGQNGTQILENITRVANETGEMGFFTPDNMWKLVLLGGGGAVLVYLIIKSVAVVGIYIFCFTFWAAYLNLLSILNTVLFITGIMVGFVAIGTAVMGFLFLAAVIGMLSNV